MIHYGYASLDEQTWPTTTDTAIKEAPGMPTPVGDLHLHLLAAKGRYAWTVRHQKSALCGTPRCRRVLITEVKEAP